MGVGDRVRPFGATGRPFGAKVFVGAAAEEDAFKLLLLLLLLLPLLLLLLLLAGMGPWL